MTETIRFPERDQMRLRLTGFTDEPRVLAGVYDDVVDLLGGREVSATVVKAELARTVTRRAAGRGTDLRRLFGTAVPLFVLSVIDDEQERAALARLIDRDAVMPLPSRVDIVQRLSGALDDERAFHQLYPRIAQVLGGRRVFPVDVALCLTLATFEYTVNAPRALRTVFRVGLRRLAASIIDEAGAKTVALAFIDGEAEYVDEQLMLAQSLDT
jgi:hypothetical protein